MGAVKRIEWKDDRLRREFLVVDNGAESSDGTDEPQKVANDVVVSFQKVAVSLHKGRSRMGSVTGYFLCEMNVNNDLDDQSYLMRVRFLVKKPISGEE